MQLFFEEDGVFKAGNVLKKDGTAYQAELPTGRRTKVKGGHVFFEFESPAAAEFLARAQALASETDPAFLWEVAPEDEFGYEDIASEYFTSPGSVEKAAALIALHGNPVYFYRKGRGHYKKAPADVLQRALAAIKKREAMEKRRDEMVAEMAQGRVPPEIAANPFALLLSPDKNSMEWKALSAAADAEHMSPLRLMLKIGAVKSPYAWHVGSFYSQYFPRGTAFPMLPDPVDPDVQLAQAQVEAFSIDDSKTTEIDDAASVTDLPDGKKRIGIHIAAPSLVMARDTEVDKAARARMSTVYGPGIKTTMLPEKWIKAASLDEGHNVPCVSLYLTVDADTMEILGSETRLERITVRQNLRYDLFEPAVTEAMVVNHELTIPFAREIEFLWHFAKARLAEREEVRGKPEILGRIEWGFEMDGEGEAARVTLKPRKRGEPIDLLVAELAICANCTWGLWLEEHGYAGIYRSQRMGRVRMSTVPGPHDGLGVPRYAWSTSPLRRYVDMVNQRQIISAVLGRDPVYQGNDADFFSIVSRFDDLYTAYNDFQRRMERYWSLRYIEQEGLKEVIVSVVKEELVRVEGLPFLQRIPGLPQLERGRRLRLAVIGCDYIDLLLETRLLEVLPESESTTDMAGMDEEDAQEVDAAQEEKPQESLKETPTAGEAGEVSAQT